MQRTLLNSYAVLFPAKPIRRGNTISNEYGTRCGQMCQVYLRIA